MHKLIPILFALLTPAFAFAQGTINGAVTDVAGEPLPGASIQLAETPYGMATRPDGTFSINNVPAGSYMLRASFIGFTTHEEQILVQDGQTLTVAVSLAEVNRELQSISIFASRAIDRVTPVAYTDIPKEEIEQQLGSRDLPLVLNTAPSVYATENGGGTGDARINVRGFDQRNTAVMINGVPVNDMENGWVYWSNWDGVGDVATSIQLQRGLAAVNLAVPSIGGTLNILTDPAQNDSGVMFKQEVGDAGFLKSTLRASTGRMSNGLAFTALGVRKTGNGIVDATWTDAWAYYLAGSYQISASNSISLYAVGAPQRHGQNLYRQNIGAYDADFARSLGDYDQAALEDYPEATSDRYGSNADEAEAGMLYNETFNFVNPSYSGMQYSAGGTHSRYESDLLNERENYYHKPQVNLNWYSQLSNQILLSTVAYYSGGTGGGSGTLGSLVWDYNGPSRIADWNATIARNRSDEFDDEGNLIRPAGESAGVLRNSTNNQWTLGVISKLTMDVSEMITAEVGVDGRTATIDHYREVRDLLGGDYFVDDSDFFSGERQVGLGDKVAYYFQNKVNWLGGYAQAELVQGPFSAFGMAGLTTTKYNFEDFFNPDPDNPSQTLQLQSDNMVGYQFKTGALYNITDAVGVYGNLGYIAKTPILDGVINDQAGTLNPNPENEDIVSFEAGVNYRSPVLALKLSAYRTTWNNRTVNRGIDNPDTGEEAIVFLRGVEQLHNGVELEGSYLPIEQVRVDAGISIGDWNYTSDVSGQYELADRTLSVPVEVPIDGLKVGDQPQTQLTYALSLFPTEDLTLQVLGRTYARHFAAFDPLSRALFDEDGDGQVDSTPDRAQSWQAPGYSVFDLNFGYRIPLNTLPVSLDLTANVFNLFDATYILDATDNSSFNGFDGDHDADDAEVYFGLPRRFNIGLRLTY